MLAYSPTESATGVAGVLVAALRGAGMLEGQGGRVGRVEISVGAGVSVVGCRNAVGGRAAVGGVVGRGKAMGVEKGEVGKRDGDGDGDGDGGRKRGADGVSFVLLERRRRGM